MLQIFTCTQREDNSDFTRVGAVIILHPYYKELSTFIRTENQVKAELLIIRDIINNIKQPEKQDILIAVRNTSSLGVLQLGWEVKDVSEVVLQIKNKLSKFKSWYICKSNTSQKYSNRAYILSKYEVKE